MSVHVPVITQSYEIHQLRDQRKTLAIKRPELVHDLTELRIKSFELLADEFNLADDWIKPAFDVFYEARQQVTLFEDVHPVLDELVQTYRLISLTNGNASTIKTGVDHWFDFSLNSTIAGKLKSEPDIYWLAQRQAGIQAQQMVHIGDDPLYDVAGAKASGSKAIWLNREQKIWPLEDCQPDEVISNLYELPQALSRLLVR
jgi:putative hydrolase of the HAD superfamily